jgi:hypothetical protein
VKGCFAKVAALDPKKVIGLKTIDCVFIKYAYNNSAYRFFIQKSSIKDICHNFIMESGNVTFFEDVFL